MHRRQVPSSITSPDAAAGRRLRLLLALGPGTIYSLECGSYKITFISENVAELVGFVAAQFLESGFWHRHLHPEDLHRVDHAFAELAANGHHAYEYRFLHADGAYRWMYDEMNLIRSSDGLPDEVFGVWLDISPRREAEEALRRAQVRVERHLSELQRTEGALRLAKEEAERTNRAQSDFLAHMSHELRTPLNSILGFGELLEDGSCGDLNPLQAQYLEDILFSSRHLLTLINDLLDLVKVQAGRLDLEPVEIEVGPFLTDITREAQVLAQAAGLRLLQEVEPRLPLIFVDPRRFKQMVLILLSNAIKFSPRGCEVVVSAQFAELIRPNGAAPLAGPWLSIGVADDGAGIDPRHLDVIFNVFEQIQGAQKVCSGTGLGLALIRRLAQQHGGHTWAESPGLGRGSTFFLALPTGRPAERTGGEAASQHG